MQEPDGKKFVEDDFELEDFKRRSLMRKLFNAEIRKNKKAIRLLSVFTVALFALAAYFAVRVVGYNSEIKESAASNEIAREVAAEFSESKPAESTEIPAPAEAEADEPAEAAPEEERQVLEKIQNLRETFLNDEIVGHLRIKGTNIDYAVTQAKDNKFYLDKDLFGEENVAGSIFIDYECDMDEISRNTVIFGHNMRDGSMFHNLRYYADEDYRNEHRFVLLTTPYEETTWEVFSYYKTKTDFYYIQVIFPDDEAFASLVSQMKEKSMYDTGVSVGVNDKILTLSTCSNAAEDERLVLNAKLVDTISAIKP